MTTTFEEKRQHCRDCGSLKLKWRPPLRADDPRPVEGRPIFECRSHAYLCPTCDCIPGYAVIVPAPAKEPREPKWRLQSASEKQIRYLADLLGHEPTGDLTKGEACDLIGALVAGREIDEAFDRVTA